MSKKKKLTKLTLEQERQLLLKPCKTKEELKAWIKYFLDLELPDVTVSRYSDTNPLNVIWEVYDICVNKNNPENIKELLFVAGRGSGKTLGMAIAELMILLHDKREVVHVGAIQNQAERCYNYQKNFLYNRKLKPLVMPEGVPENQRILEKANMSKSIFNVGGEKLTLEVIPCTLKACTDPESIIIMGDGSKKKAKELKIGDVVKTIAEDNTLTHTAKIKHLRLVNKPCYRVNFSDNSILIAAKNHKVLTKNGWLEIKDLIPGSRLLRFDSDFGYSDYQLKFNFNEKLIRSALVGKMLGNATLSFKDEDLEYILCLEYPLAQEEYLNYFAQIISPLVKVDQIRNKKSNYNSDVKELITESTKNLAFLKDLFYGIKDKKTKRITQRIETYLDECALAFWFIDSGFNGKNAIFAARNFTVDDVDILINILRNKFKLFGTKRKLDSSGLPYILLNAESTKRLYEIIAPYVHPSMAYKIQNRSVGYAYRLSDGKKVIYSNSLPKDDINSKTYKRWKKQFLRLPDVEVVSTVYVGEHPTIEIQVDSSTYTQQSYLCNGFISHNTNGPHVPLVVVDEIDTVSGEGVKAFKEISGMLDSKNGKIALRVGISTRKSRYGLMNKQIENADAEGRTVRRWTAFEFTERCDDKRSGTKEIDLYVNQDKMEVLTKEEFEKRDKNKQKEYVQYKGYEGCAKCPLFSICLTDAKKQTSKSPMLKTLDELIQKVRSEGPDWALAQLMNLKPSVEGIIYREFDEKVHVKTWNEMWYILTGKEFPGHCTHDIFVKKCFSEDTEVLTQNGFKLFKDLTPYDKIASLDDDGKLIYEKPLDYISYYYSGNAYNLYNKIGGHGKQLDLIMTEDHNQVYVEPRDIKNKKIKYRKDKIQNLIKKKFYIPAVPLKSEFNSVGYSPISFMTPEQYASFMGLWLSEGSCASINSNNKFRHNTVTICQSKSHNIDKIDKLMSSIKWPSKLHRRIDKRDMSVSWSIYNKELYDHVKRWRYAVNKSIDRAFFDNASQKQMKLMLEWLLLGDGSEYKSNPKQQPYYGTGSEKLANDVQELCFRLGYRTNLTYKYNRPLKHHKNGTEFLKMFRVHIHMKRPNNGAKYWYINNGKNISGFSNKKSHNIDRLIYNGNVYCVTMPSGRLFVRRNGVIALSGNCHELQLPCYAGIDWGFSSPNTVVFFFMDKRDNVYVVRTDGMTHISTPAWIHHIKTKYHNMYRVQLYVPDQADQGAIQEMQKAGLPVSNTAKKEPIMTGIQVIKKLLKVPGSSEAKLFLNKETCSHIISEFSLYHYKLDAAGLVTDDPDTENDHWLDALRYPLTLLLGKTNVILGGGLEYDNMQGLVDSQGSYHRTPTAAEFAAVNGIKFNDVEEDTSKLGKIGTKKELDDDDEDSGTSGQGGFLWSF